MKRYIILLLLLVVLSCSLAFPVFATEVTENDDIQAQADSAPSLGTSNFSVTAISQAKVTGSWSYFYENPDAFGSVFYNAYATNSCIIMACTPQYLIGYYWNDAGAFRLGVWTNPLGQAHASLFGVFPKSSYELLVGYKGINISAWSPSPDCYFSQSLAENVADFDTINVAAVDWSKLPSSYGFYTYLKRSTNLIWDADSVHNGLYSPANIGTEYVAQYNKDTIFYPASAADILWNVVPEGGTPSGSGGSADGGNTTSPYIYVSCPSTVTKGMPIIPWAELQNAGDISGSILCFLSGHNSAYTKLTASSGNANMWTLDCGQDETASTLTLTFMVDGRPDIYTTFHVSVLDPSPGLGGDSSDLPGSDYTEPAPTVPDYSDEIKNGMQQIQDQEREQADFEGQDAVDQIIDIIPDESESFGEALGSLINLLSYEGTAAVLTMPAIKIPAIDGLFPEITVLEEQEVDFEFYISMLPDVFMSLTWAFFDIAIVYYCLKEFMDLIGGFSNGFANISGAWGKLDE